MRLNFIEHPGTGPKALLVHGMLASRSYWDDNLAELSQVCQPVVVELWGHGQSPTPGDQERFSPEGYIAEFEHIRRGVTGSTNLGNATASTADKPTPVWLIGQSMGAALMLHYALAHPEHVIGLIMTNSTSAFSDPVRWEQIKVDTEANASRIEAQGVESLRDHWINPSRSKRISAEIRQKLETEFSEHDSVGIANSFRITSTQLPLGERLKQVAVPSLLTNGADEERFQPLLAAAQTIPGIRVVDLPAAHAVNAHDPVGWNAVVCDFIRQHSPAG